MLVTIVCVSLLSLLAVSGFSAEAGKIQVGEPAPDFTLKDQDGKEVKLSSFKEKKNVLLAFYPKDFTGG